MSQYNIKNNMKIIIKPKATKPIINMRRKQSANTIEPMNASPRKSKTEVPPFRYHQRRRPQKSCSSNSTSSMKSITESASSVISKQPNIKSFENLCRCVKSLNHQWLGKKHVCGGKYKTEQCDCPKASHLLGATLKDLSNDYILVARTYSNGRWDSVMKITELIDLFVVRDGIWDEHHLTDHNLYEVIHEEKPRKVYFDIDGYDDPTIFRRAMKLIKDTFKTRTDEDDIAVSYNESLLKDGRKKYSYHIVLSNIMFDSLEHMKRSGFIEWVRQHKTIFDETVYKRNQLMKLVGQSKYKDNRPHKMNSNDEPIEDYIIQHTNGQYNGNDYGCPKRCDIDFKLLCKENIAKVNKNNLKQGKRKITVKGILSLPRITAPQPFLHIEMSNAIDILQAFPNDRKYLNRYQCSMCAIWAKRENLTFEEFYNWCFGPFGYDEQFKLKWETRWNGELQTIIDDKKQKKRLWSRYHIFQLLERFYGVIKDIVLDKFKKEFISKDEGDLQITEKYITEEHLSRIPNKYLLLLLNMGGGKTYAVGQWLRVHKSLLHLVSLKNSNYTAALWITNRISMASNLMGRLNDENLGTLNFQLYTTIKAKRGAGNLKYCKKLVCELESLHLLHKANDGMYYDVVIVDEIESVFNCFASEKCHGKNPVGKHYDMNYHTFETCLKRAKKVFLMDAFLKRRTLNYIAKLDPIKKTMKRGRKTLIKKKPLNKPYLITKPNDEILRPMTYNKHYHTWVEKIVKCVKSLNEKVYIFYPYATGKTARSSHCILRFAEKLRVLCSLNQEQVLTYYGSMDGKKKREQLLKVNQYWNTAKIVITNTCITVGVSYDLLDFDTIFLSYDEFLNPIDPIQSSFRIRNTKRKRIEFYRFPNMRKMIALKNGTRYIPTRMKKLKLEQPTEAFKYMAQFLEEEYNAKGYELLKLYFEYTGYTFDNFDKIENKGFKKLYTKTNVENTIYDYNDIDTTYNVEGLVSKQYKGEATAYEQLQLCRFFLDRNFTTDTPIEQKEKFWEEPRLLEGINMLFTNNPCLERFIQYDSLLEDNGKEKDGFGTLEHFKFQNITNETIEFAKQYLSFDPNLEISLSKLNNIKREFTIKKVVLEHFFGKNIMERGDKITVVEEGKPKRKYTIKINDDVRPHFELAISHHKKITRPHLRAWRKKMKQAKVFKDIVVRGSTQRFFDATTLVRLGL